MPKSGTESKRDFTTAKAQQQYQRSGPPPPKPSKQAILDGLRQKPKRRKKR